MNDYEIVYRSSLFKGARVKTISAYTESYAQKVFVRQMLILAKWFQIKKISRVCKH